MICSGRVKVEDLRPEQKWDFISLNDFKSSSCLNMFAYGYLWVSLLISVAVYGVDTFTAVNLLAFDRWSGEFQPVIPFKAQKWIFAGCIIASWVNLGFEHLRANRVIRRGAVAESFLDSLAVRIQSARVGKKGRGWRRFLVFAELTKSKKGAEYVALFTYFSFQSWIRIIFCQGPRQVLNALTLYSVFKLNLSSADTSSVGSTLASFFRNIGKLAEEDHQQAVILSGMVFTLVIWVFGALSLLLAMLFYVLFLWHYIPNADGGLSGYCARKVDRRLAKIVSVKVNKAIEEEERKRMKADAKALKNGEKPSGRQATLPTLFDAKGDQLPQMPMLNRNDTMTTLPVYSSRPGTPSDQPPLPGFELDTLGQKRPFPSRSGTAASTASFASNAPLMGNASDMGFGRSASPAPSLPSLDTSAYPQQPQRSLTSNSNTSNFGRTPVGVPPRMPSAMGDRGYTASPVSYTPGPGPSLDSYGRPMPRAVDDLRSNTPAGPAPSMGRRTPFDQGIEPPRSIDNYGRSSPAPGRGMNGSQGSIDDYGRSSPAPRGPNSSMNPGYQPYNPNMRSASAAPSNPNFPSENRGPQQYRNMTEPSPISDYYGSNTRPGTAQSQASRLVAQNTGLNINRLASPAPYNGGGTQSPSFGGPGTPPLTGPMYRR